MKVKNTYDANASTCLSLSLVSNLRSLIVQTGNVRIRPPETGLTTDRCLSNDVKHHPRLWAGFCFAKIHKISQLPNIYSEKD